MGSGARVDSCVDAAEVSVAAGGGWEYVDDNPPSSDAAAGTPVEGASAPSPTDVAAPDVGAVVDVVTLVVGVADDVGGLRGCGGLAVDSFSMSAIVL